MNIKTCRHCDMSFNRVDEAPIPHDRCERCHEKIEAMGGPADVALCNKNERESCDMTDEHPLDRLAQAGLVRAAAKWERGDMEARSKYHREIKPGVWVDVYSVLVAFNVTNPADAHAIKKMLMPGRRGTKDSIQDREEAIASIKRAIEIERDSAHELA